MKFKFEIVRSKEEITTRDFENEDDAVDYAQELENKEDIDMVLVINEEGDYIY